LKKHHDPESTTSFHTFCDLGARYPTQRWAYWINGNHELSHKERGPISTVADINGPNYIYKKFSFATVIHHLYARTAEVDTMSPEMTRQRVYCFLDDTPDEEHDYTKIKLQLTPNSIPPPEPAPEQPTEPTEPETATESSNQVDPLTLQFGSHSGSDIAHLYR
jgi:hypothetical protein